MRAQSSEIWAADEYPWEPAPPPQMPAFWEHSLPQPPPPCHPGQSWGQSSGSLASPAEAALAEGWKSPQDSLGNQLPKSWETSKFKLKAVPMRMFLQTQHLYWRYQRGEMKSPNVNLPLCTQRITFHSFLGTGANSAGNARCLTNWELGRWDLGFTIAFHFRRALYQSLSFFPKKNIIFPENKEDIFFNQLM